LEWIEAERRAESVCCWEPLLIPGLVQTAGYARALFEAWRSAGSHDELDQLVNGRMGRQLIFERPEPPRNGATTVYMESPDQGQTTETPSVAAKINATFDTLRAEALPRAASRDLIRKVAEEQRAS
jgi:hypothetical protein